MSIRIRPIASDEHARRRLVELVDERREDYVRLSRMMHRPAGYLGLFVTKGVPKRLPDRERRLLAEYFRIEECELGVAVTDA